MSRITPEKEIYYISKVIEKNIYYYDTKLKDKGFLSENILSQLRNLVEDVVILINNRLNRLNLDSHYNNVSISFEAIKGIAKYKFLIEFHEYLQGTASHYTPNEDGAERLVKHYFRYICLIKLLLKQEFNIEIINNIESFPIYDDKSMKENYDVICDKVEHADITKSRKISGRFYVEKTNTIYSKGNVYYEITLSKASDYNNKFERLTFYSKQYIPDNYSINILAVDDKANLNVGKIKIKIITAYKISIRICELKNLFFILGENKNFDEKYKEYRNLMEFLTTNGFTIKKMICLNSEDFDNVIKYIKNGAENHHISEMLIKIREIVLNNKPGCNILRYLTTKMVNIVIRNQMSLTPHRYLSNLYIHSKSSMFDAMPYAMSLHYHNPNYSDLIQAIDIDDRDDELLYSYIRNNIENKDQLYTPLEEINYFDNIPLLVKKYNMKLLSRKPTSNGILVLENNYIYIKEYEDKSIEIIKKLEECTLKKDESLNKQVNIYMEQNHNLNISEDKKKVLNQIFKLGPIAFIYGPAGTGKTKMIEILSKSLTSLSICIISTTDTAVSNIRSRLELNSNIETMNIRRYLNNSMLWDILIIDECSTVNNSDMLKILEKSEYKAIIMVGDVYQIEPIQYGNWFRLCNKYFKSGFSFELEKTHRTTEKDLLDVWTYVRKNNPKIINLMQVKEYSEEVSEKIFERTSDEEIVLCLNYDGMYGINNINRVMQNSNSNKEYNFGVDTFKVGDPVLFNDCPRFKDILHNNLKGNIVAIEQEENCMWFSIEIDKDDISQPLFSNDLIISNSDNQNKIIVKFKVNEFRDMDEDEDEYGHIIPFNLSYASSIHKAQGLEYDTVKIIITQNVEDRITKNIFYTAITRAKKNLKVYWSSSSQIKILESFNKSESKRDLAILNQKIKLSGQR